MSLITAKDLTKSYGAQDVLRQVSLSVPHQARIGLIGPNGVGKSTLLRLLSGHERPDSGRVYRARDLSIGFLPQEAAMAGIGRLTQDPALWELAVDAFQSLRSMEAELAELEQSMADPKRTESAMAKYGPLQEAFERGGGYTYPSAAGRVLTGLGFTEDDYPRRLSTFSGGEATRALLARLLLEDPDLLILDEPTNHLDLGGVEWLEAWLGDWPGGVILVSHDRYFLDRTIDTIWELSSEGLWRYRGNYTEFLEQKEQHQLHLAGRLAKQEEHIRREREYIRRNIAGQNTRQAKGRRKRLERFLRQSALGKPARRQGKPRLNFLEPERSGDLILRTHSLAVGRPGKGEGLYAVPDLQLRRGECAGLIGPNGAGKTTFLKTILGELAPHEGSLSLGAKIRPGYFAQAEHALEATKTVLENMLQADPSLTASQARDFLAGFEFSGDSVDKRVNMLSGGERSKLALAKLVIGGANLLLLDEPTNHLDLASQESLQEALESFDGTIILVSHDRYLLNRLATQIWALRTGTGLLETFDGGYQDYLEARSEDLGAEEEAPESPSEPKATHKRPSEGAGRRQLERVESRIEDLEAELHDLGDQIQQASTDLERVRLLGQRYATLEQELASWMDEWERLSHAQQGA